MKGTIVLTIVLIAALGFTACAPVDDEAAPDTSPTTTTTVATTSPVTTIPSALTADASELSQQIDAVYPGIPGDKAADWAHYTCREIEKGERDPAEYVAHMFAGGSRPDPTPEQVAAILAVIEPTC